MTKRIDVKGAIISNDEQWIYDIFGIQATSPSIISNAIKEANGDNLEVYINSGGGSVYDASEIYTELKSYSGNVHTKIVGLGASAASVIAMSGDKVSMAPTGQMMIHNASVSASGDYHAMDKASEFLKNINQSIVNAYKLKSGKSEEELLQLMDNETWLTPQQAIEYNLIDEIMFDDGQLKATASTYQSVVIPEAVIDGIKKGSLNKANSKGNFVSEESLKQLLAEFKAELKNELKPKEPEQVPAAASAKRNLSKLFLHL